LLDALIGASGQAGRDKEEADWVVEQSDDWQAA